MWNDPVVDLKHPERESETEQIDDDRGREHIGRQARQRSGEKAEETRRIAHDQSEVLSTRVRATRQRTQRVASHRSRDASAKDIWLPN